MKVITNKCLNEVKCHLYGHTTWYSNVFIHRIGNDVSCHLWQYIVIYTVEVLGTLVLAYRLSFYLLVSVFLPAAWCTIFIDTSGIDVTCGAYKFNSSLIFLHNFLYALRAVHIEQVFLDQPNRPVLLSGVNTVSPVYFVTAQWSYNFWLVFV